MLKTSKGFANTLMKYKKSLLLFIAMFCILLSATVHLILAPNISASIVSHKTEGTDFIPHLETYTLLLTLTLGLIGIWLARKGDGGSMFYLFFMLNALVLGGYAYLSYSDSFLLKNDLLTDAFYSWINAAPVFSIALAWGIASQAYSFKVAAIQYPILGLFSLSIAPRISYIISMQNDLFSHGVVPELVVLAALSLLALAAYPLLQWNRIEESEKSDNVSWKYWAVLAVIIFCVNSATILCSSIFTNQVISSGISSPKIQHFITQLPIYVTASAIMANVLGVGIGLFLYIKGPKRFAAITTLPLGRILLGGWLMFNFPLSANKSLLAQSHGFLIVMGAVSLYELLIQLAYFGIEREKRFTAKLAIDVIMITITNHYAATWFASESKQLIMFFSVTGFIICAIGLRYIQKRFNAITEAPSVLKCLPPSTASA